MLAGLGLLRAPTAAALAAPLKGANGTVGQSFEERQWTLLFLIVETSACLSEVRPPYRGTAQRIRLSTTYPPHPPLLQLSHRPANS